MDSGSLAPDPLRPLDPVSTHMLLQSAWLRDHMTVKDSHRSRRHLIDDISIAALTS